MTVLPFSDFLELLRAKGFGVGLHEHLALGKLLSRWDSIDRDELRGAIAALVARREDEVVAILRLFDEVYPRDVVQPSEAAREPKEPTRKYRLVQLAKARSFWLAAVVLAVLLPLGVAYFNYMDLNWPQPPAVAVVLPSLPVPNPIAPPAPLPDTLIEYQSDPSSTLPTPPVNFKWPSLAALGGASLAVTLVALWGVRMRRSAREWTVDAWHKALAAMPGPYHSRLILNDLVTRMPREDLEEAATLLGRAFARDSLGRELDVPRTLQQTLRAGLRPHLVYKPRRVQETIVVLIDHSQAMNAHARRVNGLVADLARYGIAMERWYFDGDIAVQSARPFGPPVALADLVRRREHAPTLVISTGFELAATLGAQDRSWLRALQSWSRRVWLTPITDESLWPAALVRLPIPVVGMNRAGLLRAANILARGDNETVGVSGRTGVAVRPVTLDDVNELKQLASVVPYPTIELLELLRQRFAPQVPESAVFHVPAMGQTHAGVPIEMSDGEIRDNLRRLRRDRASLEAGVREYLLDVLRDSEPVAGSVAHLRWQVSMAIHEVQLAALRGDDAAPGLRKIAGLARGPLWEELRESIARLPDSGPLADDMRKTAGMKEQSADPPSFEDRTGGLGVPRFRWVWPSARELGFSLGVALIAAAIASLAAPFRAQASHLLNAYALDYEPPQARELAGVLRVRAAANATAPPRRFQVYQDDQPFGGPREVDADGSAAVRVESSGEAHVYQVRGALPTGALAVSNALLAPSVLVVIDAQPWARATIRSSGDRIRPITDVTPVAVRLPEGTYELAFENGGVTQPLNQQIDVTTAGLRVFRFDMPGFDPQALIRQLESPRSAR
jgi:hypothetical protein